MPLATCRDCNREVSTLARHCVHCGRPRPTGTSSCSVIAGILTVVVALALTGAVVLAARKACKKLSDRAQTEYRILRDATPCSSIKLSSRPVAADATLEDVRRSLEERGLKVEQDGPNRLRVELAPKPATEKN